jgi:hypothetical protein
MHRSRRSTDPGRCAGVWMRMGCAVKAASPIKSGGGPCMDPPNFNLDSDSAANAHARTHFVETTWPDLYSLLAACLLSASVIVKL